MAAMLSKFAMLVLPLLGPQKDTRRTVLLRVAYFEGASK